MNIFKKIFRKESKIIEQPKVLSETNIGNIKVFDDICIWDGNTLYNGWVYGKTSSVIHVVYTDADNKLQYAEFKIERPLDKTEITQNNLTLIL